MARILKATLAWLDDRTGVVSAGREVAEHPVPGEVTSSKGGWWYVLGVATLTAFLIQLGTGVALATLYIPSAESAYDSLVYISNQATMGRIVRGMHYFGASAMIVLVSLHAARVFLTGSFKFPREFNWLTGAFLLLLTFAFAFTGMLLRWDQDSIGSVVVAVQHAGRVPFVGEAIARFILAGDTISGTTLSRFYALHVFILPLLVIGLISVHLILVLRNGVSELPKPGHPVDPRTYREEYDRLLKETGKPYWPCAAWRELAASAVLTVVVAGLAIALGPRALREPPDPTITTAIPRPDWYFLWYQAYLEVLPKSISDVAIFLSPIVAGAVLLLLPFVANKGERAPSRRPWAVAAVFLTGMAVVIFLIVGITAPYVPRFNTQPLAAQQLGVTDEDALEGYRIFFEQGCQYCHGIKGAGGTHGPDLTTVMRRFPPEQVKIIILRGRGEMPAYRTSLSEEQLDRLIYFLEAVDNPR